MSNLLRFRFSLRTMFVVVTVVGLTAGWLAQQQKWIRDREQAIRVSGVEAYGPSKYTPWQIRLVGGMRPRQQVGGHLGWRRLRHVPTSEVVRYQRLFPEAEEVLGLDGIVYYRDRPPTREPTH